MSPRSRTLRRVAALAAVLTLAALAVSPVASADHVYSHRYLIYGRVLGSDGYPAEGKNVQVTLKNFDANLGYCGQDVVKLTTDALGNFYQCSHIDGPVTTRGSVIITVDGKEFTFDADPDHRETFSLVKLDTPSNAGEAARERWDSHYTVRGIVWQKVVGKVTLEQISVNGITIGNVPVEVKLDYNGGKTATQTVKTSREYGWFVAEFSNLTEKPTSGTVTVSSQGVTVTESLDTTDHYTHVHVDVPQKVAGYLKWTGIIGGGVVALVVVGVGGTWAWSRMSEQRQVARARESSTRKRAKK